MGSPWSSTWGSGADPTVLARITNLEDTIHEYEIFESIGSGTTGTVTKPTHGTIILDQYQGLADCLILKIDSGRPIDEVAVTALGEKITSSFNVSGAYVMSGIPSAYPVAIVYQLQLAEKYKTAELANDVILNETDVTAINRIILNSELTKDPTGFVSPKDVVITYDATTQKVTLTGNTTAYYKGVLVSALISGWLSAVHTNSVGVYFLYFDGTSFIWASSFPDFSVLQIAIINYRATNSFGNRECHGFMPWESHKNAHWNIGTYRTAGGDISGIVPLSTTASERRPNISACTIEDEDCQTVNSILSSKKYSQRFLSSADTVNYTLQANDIVPLLVENPYYNLFTSPNYGQALMPANSMMTVWLYEVPTTADAPSQEIRHVFVQGQTITQATNSSAGSLTTAYNTELLKTPLDVYLGVPAIVSAEYVCIHKFIIQFTGGTWSVRGSIKITGSRANQVGSPAGNYLSAVSTDTSLTGNGTVSSPLGLSVLTSSGTYTPTVTNTTNVAASTATICSWMRVGNVVTVGGHVLIDPTSAGATTIWELSLPVASNFTVNEQCGGSASAYDGRCFQVIGDATNNTAIFASTAGLVGTSNMSVSFSYTYVII